VHRLSQRAQGPFVEVNCAAIPEDLIESELFGHVKGSFTGATSDRPGRFEQADGGTLFLDEIADMSLKTQAKVLRVLQEQRFERVGGTTSIQVDVRVLAATNKELEEEIRDGRFREDLYFRLAVIPIRVPPLRERPEDVVPLARHFLARLGAGLGRPHLRFADGVEEALARHPWPGNVRELENAVERGVVLARGETVGLEDLLLEGPGREAPAAGGPAAGEVTLQEVVDRAAAEHVRATLAACDGRRAEAARRLGVDRTTLYRLMRRHGIEDGEAETD
jgi:DNA-binding NtrC family response regulator